MLSATFGVDLGRSRCIVFKSGRLCMIDLELSVHWSLLEFVVTRIHWSAVGVVHWSLLEFVVTRIHWSAVGVVHWSLLEFVVTGIHWSAVI